MMIRVKVNITLQVDPEDYPVPADGRVEEEFYDHMHEYVHDISGVKIKSMKIVSEEI